MDRKEILDKEVLSGGTSHRKAFRNNGDEDENEEKIREKYHKLTRFLISEHKTITTMESATAGQIASLLTDTEGSSAILKGAFVTYCNEAKILQGVPADIISEYGVYSARTAEAMAEACRKCYDADFGIGVTGTMGNVDPANHDSIPGQVYFAIVYKKKAGNTETEVFFREIPPQPGRLAYKLKVAGMIADEVLAILGSQAENHADDWQ